MMRAATPSPVAGPVVPADRAGRLQELDGHAQTVFVWAVASRLTGFLRVALIAAVLGPTFFGNLHQILI